MKVCVYRTSDFDDTKIREFDHLEDCIETLRNEVGQSMKFVVYRPKDEWENGYGLADYAVEIYDDYRE